MGCSNQPSSTMLNIFTRKLVYKNVLYAKHDNGKECWVSTSLYLHKNGDCFYVLKCGGHKPKQHIIYQTSLKFKNQNEKLKKINNEPI
jgi:hypothetical protein